MMRLVLIIVFIFTMIDTLDSNENKDDDVRFILVTPIGTDHEYKFKPVFTPGTENKTHPCYDYLWIFIEYNLEDHVITGIRCTDRHGYYYFSITELYKIRSLINWSSGK